MASKTYYGKLDCRSNNAATHQTINEEYYNLMDFLSYLSSSNVCTLISWNSGSAGAGSGAFSTKTYWDGGNPFGVGTHSVWRFNTSSTRNWEWYMYVQAVTGTNALNQTHNLPVTASATYTTGLFQGTGGSDQQGILIQVAACSGTNPWNGTISMGNSTAASPRWVSGSNDRQLYVLPRSNDLGGANVTQKANMHLFGRGAVGSTPNGIISRQHFLCDGDALLYIKDRDDVGIYDICYVGAFELRNSLTSSGIGNGPYGFCMLAPGGTPSVIEADTIPLSVVIGTTAGTVGSSPNSIGGGCAVPIGSVASGSRGMIAVSPGSTFYSKTYQPNTVTEKYDQFPIYIGFSEAPHYGLLGNLNSGLVKFVVGPEINQVTSDFRNAVFGGATALTNGKVIVPWTGSIAPGVGLSRTGSLHTWTYDYE